jgi:hypothetical protein
MSGLATLPFAEFPERRDPDFLEKIGLDSQVRILMERGVRFYKIRRKGEDCILSALPCEFNLPCSRIRINDLDELFGYIIFDGYKVYAYTDHSEFYQEIFNPKFVLEIRNTETNPNFFAW